MGVISRDKKQINCVYASDSDFGKQLEGYLESSGKDILMVNITNTMPTPTQWQELAKELNVGIEDLLDLSKVDGVRKTSNFDANDYVTILDKNPKILKGAIIINGDKTKHITNVTEVLEYFNIDSAGIEKRLHTDEPDINKSTENENFV
ncbi:arsenate reductase family protein [Winogradskyella wichelsiae]|uniref:arsenate reductase family protein n=1 Tax=Winogradskyella wichelsiae TaxID=2697007 RepID=UPI003EFA91FE